MQFAFPSFFKKAAPEAGAFIVEFSMNPLVRTLLVYGVEYLIAHEAAIESHISNPTLKKGMQDVVAACKAVLPLLQAA